MELVDLIKKIDAYKDTINKHRPLTPAEVRELDQYFKIGTTFSSNALEGNSLTLTETKVLLEDGITVGGKPIKDFYEATGHAKAYDFMLTVARSDSLNIDEEVILRLHHLFYTGIDIERAGQYRKHQVFVSGTEYVPSSFVEVPTLMKEYVYELNAKVDTMHPVLLSAYAHRRLVDIHPFEDGNGRTARLLMNLILINKGYCIISIPPVMRHEYISALITAQGAKYPTDEPFNRLIAECEIEAQRDYCRLLKISLEQCNHNPNTDKQSAHQL